MATTIQLEEDTKRTLERVKLFPRETYDQVIKRLVRNETDDEVLSPETVKNIERALEDVKAGRTYTLKEAKKKLGMK